MLVNFHGACGGHTPALSSTEVLSQNVAAVPHRLTLWTVPKLMTPAGFEPTQLALVELESTSLDHSGKVSGDLRSGVHVHPHVSRDVQGCARWIASGGTRTTHHAQQSGHAEAACSPGAAHGRPVAVCRARRCWSALAGCEQRERCATGRGTAFFS